MDGEMIERVARAIHACTDAAQEEWSDLPSYMELARAAIEAMRKPDPIMVISGLDAVSDGCDINVPETYQLWDAMITAALSPKSS